MPKKLGHFCWHISAFSLKIIALAVIVISVSMAAFVWRVSNSPLDISFAKDYIKSAMHDNVTGNSVNMKSVVLYWPDLRGALYLQLRGGELVNDKGSVIVSVDLASVSFSRAGLLTGHIMPKEIIIKRPALRLIRNKDGNLKVDLGQNNSEVKDDRKSSNEQFELTTRIFSYIARPDMQSKTSSLISHLEAFKIENARLLIDDDIAMQSWSLPDFDIGFYSTKKGMKGYANLKLPDIGFDKSELNIDMDYLWEQDKVNISADFNNIDVKAIAGKIPAFGELANQNIVFDAHIETILDNNFIPDDINIDIKSKSGDVFHPDLSDDPVPYTDLYLNASYHYMTRAFVLRDTQVTARGVTVFAKAEVTHDDDRASGPVRIWIDHMRHEQIDPLWPNILRGDGAEDWVVKKISKGHFKNIWLDFDLLAKKIILDNDSLIGPVKPSWDMDVDNLEAGFTFDNMDVDYRSPLKPAKKLHGAGNFNMKKDELVININKGKLGKLNISKARLLLDQVNAVGKGDADISMAIYGQVHDFMRFLSDDPINLDDDMDIDINKVKGMANISLSMKFPARKNVRLKDFVINVDGKLKNLLLPDVIKTLDLRGKELDFRIKNGLASMKGKAMLDNRPMDFSWETFLDSKSKPYKEKIRAKITADPNIRSVMGIDLSDFIEGSIPVDVNYVSYNNGRAKADIKADITPALFFVEPFKFEKPPGKKASATLTAYFKDEYIQKITGLTVKGKGFTLSNSEIFFKKGKDGVSMSKGSISNFMLDETKGKLDFTFNKNGAVNINMDMDFLDAQPFLGNKSVNSRSVGNKQKSSDYDAPPMKISVTANKMRTALDEIIKNTKLFFDIDKAGRFNQVNMNAKIGNGDFSISFKPDIKGKRSFKLNAGDAGAFLKAFQIYKDIRGGTLSIEGDSVRGVMDRNLIGKAEISNFKVVNEPILTNILSILSLTGIVDVLADDGLNFEKLEADFNWNYRKDGSLLVLENGRTSGNSLGLLFDGTFDNKKREIDVSGTVVPMSGLNKIIGAIPLVGDILTGGSGGVFAATYSIKGKFDNPEIFVNPLSILTPGILRRILWE